MCRRWLGCRLDDSMIAFDAMNRISCELQQINLKLNGK